MRSGLGNIVQKELKELMRDPKLMLGMIVVPLIIFPIMGGAVSTSRQATEAEIEKSTAAWTSFDEADGNGSMSLALKAFLEFSNITCRVVNASSESDAIVRAVNSGASALVIVPANFTEALLEFQPARVELYSVFRTYSMVEEVTYSKILSALTTFSTVIVAQRLQQAYPNRSVEGLAVPVMTVPHSVIRGEAYQADPNRVGASVLGSSIMMPMMVMILIIMAGQLAASSVGMEKEQKTLEVLLTLPVKRINILLGKLSGVIVVSMIATVSYLIGFSFYTNSLGISQGGLDLGTVGLSPEPTGLALLCLSLFFSLISALSLSVLLAVFTKDVRSAQSLMGVLYIPVMIPALVLMFTPISTLPLGIQVLMYAIPFTYPTLASAALFTRDYVPIMLGIIYQAVFTFIVLAIAARVFSTERIVTARLDFGRKKKPVEN